MPACLACFQLGSLTSLTCALFVSDNWVVVRPGAELWPEIVQLVKEAEGWVKDGKKLVGPNMAPFLAAYEKVIKGATPRPRHRCVPAPRLLTQ